MCARAAVARAGTTIRRGRSRRFRIAITIASAAFASLVVALAVRHFVEAGWPLSGGNPIVIGAAGALFLGANAFKAYGWRRLFRRGEQPQALALAAAGGGASLMGLALPGRFDEAVRVAIVRRYPSCPTTVAPICLSLFTLGLIDNVALSPLAAVSASFAGLSAPVRAGYIVVAAGGVGAAALIVALPRLTRVSRLVRFRLVRWLQPRATCTRDAARAWALVLISWLVRVLALFLLLHTFGIATSLPLAIMYVCASAASAAIPIGPAGAATQVAAGTALLAVSGVGASRALGFALAAQSLFILAGAAMLVLAVSWRACLRLRVSLAY